MRWTRRAEAWEEDGTINDAIPQSLLARFGSQGEINGRDGYKIHDCLFFLLPENVWVLKMRRCLAVFTLTRRWRRGGAGGRLASKNNRAQGEQSRNQRDAAVTSRSHPSTTGSSTVQNTYYTFYMREKGGDGTRRRGRERERGR